MARGQSGRRQRASVLPCRLPPLLTIEGEPPPQRQDRRRFCQNAATGGTAGIAPRLPCHPFPSPVCCGLWSSRRVALPNAKQTRAFRQTGAFRRVLLGNHRGCNVIRCHVLRPRRLFKCRTLPCSADCRHPRHRRRRRRWRIEVVSWKDLVPPVRGRPVAFPLPQTQDGAIDVPGAVESRRHTGP